MASSSGIQCHIAPMNVQAQCCARNGPATWQHLLEVHPHNLGSANAVVGCTQSATAPCKDPVYSLQNGMRSAISSAPRRQDIPGSRFRDLLKLTVEFVSLVCRPSCCVVAVLRMSSAFLVHVCAQLLDQKPACPALDTNLGLQQSRIFCHAPTAKHAQPAQPSRYSSERHIPRCMQHIVAPHEQQLSMPRCPHPA